MTKKFSFTRRAVEFLPAHAQDSPSREAEYSDAGCVGLHLRVSKGGRKFYQLRYKFHGRKRCLSLGEHTERFGVQEARTLVAEHKALLARGVDPLEEREARRADLTFDEFAEQHYLPLAKARKKSWANDEYWIKHNFSKAIGKRMLKSVTAKDVASLHLAERNRSSAVSANGMLAILKVMFSTAVKLGFVEKNVAAGQEKYKDVAPPRTRYLTREELPRFLAALEGAGSDHGVAALRLLLFTGMRRTECLTLKWEQVSLERRTISLPVTKNSRPRHVYANSRALAVLQQLADSRASRKLTRESEYVFPSATARKKGHLSDLRVPFNEACKRAGIANLCVHDLRRSFGSHCAMAGVSIYSVQKLLGHRDVAITESTYAHLSNGSLLDASEGMVTMLEEAEAEAARKRKAESGAASEQLAAG